MDGVCEVALDYLSRLVIFRSSTGISRLSMFPGRFEVSGVLAVPFLSGLRDGRSNS